MYITLIIIISIASSVLGQTDTIADCQWTICQSNTTQVVTCAEFGAVDNGTQACDGGVMTYCCVDNSVSVEGGLPEVSLEEFNNAVTSNAFPAPSLEQYNSFVLGINSSGITTKQEAAMALSQFMHESDGLRAKRQYACQVTNCPGLYVTPGCDVPGQYYYGRGYIQLTWCYNYQPASISIFGDNRLVLDPDMVAREENTAWDTAFWFWRTFVHSDPGVAAGQFGASTNIINGYEECSVLDGLNPNPLALRRYDIYRNVRAAFGLPGPGDPSGCYLVVR